MTETIAAPGLLAITVAALQDSGRMVATDWEAETFDVLSPDDAARPDGESGSSVLGVVLRHTRAVVFYAVWDDPVPADRRLKMSELVLRANTDLFTSAFEFDLESGILSVRSSVALADVPIAAPGDPGPPAGTKVLNRSTLTTLLLAALEEVEEVAADHADEVARTLTARAS